mgnify:CR=1 FL=1
MALKNEIVACICEGAFERIVMEVLLDADCLEFSWCDLLEGDLVDLRNARRFTERYLHRDYGETHIRIIRILDSRSERFDIPEFFQGKISRIQSYFTRPEIEILVIIHEACYDEYTKKYAKMKPSVYCKSILAYPNVKRAHFVQKYFNGVEKLIYALKRYKELRGHTELCIYDLLKESIKR